MQLALKLSGGGLSGYGLLLPPSDIRGIRFGCEARKILVELPHSSYLHLEHSIYDSWQMFPRPSPPNTRKVMNRLLSAGLVWWVDRYNFDGKTGKPLDNDIDYYFALTDLGQSVVEVFGNDMKQGRKVRWDKWKYPSIACTEELQNQIIDKMINNSVLNEEQLTPKDVDKMKRALNIDKKPYKAYPSSYGNSQDYLLRRIIRYDEMWGDAWMAPVFTSD